MFLTTATSLSRPVASSSLLQKSAASASLQLTKMTAQRSFAASRASAEGPERFFMIEYSYVEDALYKRRK